MSTSLANTHRQLATGAGAIANTLAPGVPFRLLRVELHLSAAPTTSENFTATLDAGDGSAYDTVLIKQDLSANSVVDKAWVFGEGFEYGKDDEVDYAYTNTDTGTYGLKIVYEIL